MPKIPGWQQHPYGSVHEYHGVIRPGDEFRAIDKEHGIKEIPAPNGWPHRVFVSNMSRTFINQRDEIVCSFTNQLRSVARFPGEEEPIPEKKVHKCTKKELDMYHKAYDEELEGKWRRGADIRYWEDTQVGEALHPLILGPYDITDSISFIGALGTCFSYAVKWGHIRGAREAQQIEAFLEDPKPEPKFRELTGITSIGLCN